jgi:hypothetical protein
MIDICKCDDCDMTEQEVNDREDEQSVVEEKIYYVEIN